MLSVRTIEELFHSLPKEHPPLIAFPVEYINGKHFGTSTVHEEMQDASDRKRIATALQLLSEQLALRNFLINSSRSFTHL